MKKTYNDFVKKKREIVSVVHFLFVNLSGLGNTRLYTTMVLILRHRCGALVLESMEILAVVRDWKIQHVLSQESRLCQKRLGVSPPMVLCSPHSSSF
jgi:hypothetical protein